MASEEETNLFGVEPGCALHGDEKMRECSMCGAEYCTACHPRSAVCPDCSQSSDEDDDEDPDFEDVNNLGNVLKDDDDLRSGAGKDREY